MCVGLSAKVLSVDNGTALIDATGAKREVSAELLADLEPGDYVMVHAGIAIAKIAADGQLRKRCLEDVALYEACLPLAEKYGYKAVSDFSQDSLEGTLTRRKPLPDGGYLSLRLDWILSRGIEADQGRNIPTYQESWSFAPENSALARFAGQELSDHNAVWANYHWNEQ
jgi:hydrogenase expression/formation protein HypC